MLPPFGAHRAQYLAKVARSVGCPAWLIEDAVQDMELTFLLRGAEFPRSAAIDFLRREGPTNRYGDPRPQAKSFTDDDAEYWWEPDETDEVIARVDAPELLHRVLGVLAESPPGQRKAVLVYLRGDSKTPAHHVHLYQFRQRLKAIA